MSSLEVHAFGAGKFELLALWRGLLTPKSEARLFRSQIAILTLEEMR